MTDAMDIKQSKTLRRLDLNEVCEVVEGPIPDESMDIMRLHVKSLKDDLDGWVTPVGNQGTVFLEEGGVLMKVVKDTILTPKLSLSASDEGTSQTRKLRETTRKLKVGELLEVREWMKKEEESGLMRMKVKAKKDGMIGWATALGTGGVKFLESA